MNRPAREPSSEAPTDPWSEAFPVPARPLDPRPFLPTFDHRHHHVDLRVAGDEVVGTLDACLLPPFLAWAEAEGLGSVVEGTVPAPAVAVRGVRLRGAPTARAERVTELRVGEPVEVVVREGRWLRVRTAADRYLGWARATAVAPGRYEATHRVAALRGHLYTGPRVQCEVVGRVAWGDRLQVRDEMRGWSEVRLPDARTAFLLSELLAPVDEVPNAAPLDTWESLLGTPYLWGGGTAWGIDCSGFVQLLTRMAGGDLPRDADEQFAAGTRVEAPRPGDLVCFRGHVGLYLGDDRMAHASGRAMRVVETEAFATPDDRERFLGFVRPV